MHEDADDARDIFFLVNIPKSVIEAAPAKGRKLLFSPGSGVAYGLEANENGCRALKIRVGARRGGAPW